MLVGPQAAQEPVGGEDRQAGVFERHQAHQHVAVRSLAADLVGVDASGLVAVVAVGDQELGGVERPLDGVDRVGRLDAPHPVDGAIVVGRLAPRVRCSV